MALTPEQRELVALVRRAVGASDAVFADLWIQIEAIFSDLPPGVLSLADQRAIMRDIDLVLDRTFGLTQEVAPRSTLYRSIRDSTDMAAESPFRRTLTDLARDVNRRVPNFWPKQIVAKADPTSPDPLLRTIAVLDGPIVDKQRLLRSGLMDPQRRWVTGDGTPYRLSDRVWRGGQNVRRQIDERLRQGIASGEDALKIAKDLEQYLKPEFAPVQYLADGRIVRRNMTNTPGRGGHGSTFARALTRTEISRVHGAATIESAKVVPGVKGVSWLLSNRHPEPDRCDENATRDAYDLGPGVYPPNEVPIYPNHTLCLCCLAHAHEDREDTIDRVIRKYRDPIDRSTDDIDGVAANIGALNSREVLLIAGIDQRVIERARIRVVENRISISASERDHIYESHPDMRGNESAIVQVLRSPDDAFWDTKYDRTINFARPVSIRNDVMVSVEIDQAGSRHRVKSARIQNHKRTTKMKEKSDMVFEGKGVLINDGK